MYHGVINQMQRQITSENNILTIEEATTDGKPKAKEGGIRCDLTVNNDFYLYLEKNSEKWKVRKIVADPKQIAAKVTPKKKQQQQHR